MDPIYAIAVRSTCSLSPPLNSRSKYKLTRKNRSLEDIWRQKFKIQKSIGGSKGFHTIELRPSRIVQQQLVVSRLYTTTLQSHHVPILSRIKLHDEQKSITNHHTSLIRYERYIYQVIPHNNVDFFCKCLKSIVCSSVDVGFEQKCIR